MPVPATPKDDLKLLEVFSSLQGEGELVGRRQIFLRLAGCNLNCAYCDTDFSIQPFCRVEDAPGSGRFRNIPNPVSLEILTDILSDWVSRDKGVHHSISLTGGEPLLQAASLSTWAAALRDILPLHLETNGTLPGQLAPLLPHLDWISMDVKLPSVAGQPALWKEHRDFLALATRRPCWVKAVVGVRTPVDEIIALATMVHEVAPEVPVILQPATIQQRVEMTAAQLLALQAAVARIHADVRVIPQTHAFLGVL